MAPTVPLAKAPGPPRPGAPVAAPPGAKVEAGASTVPLSKAPAVPKAPGTAPLVKTGGPTQNLPKATVQLARGTQPMAGKTGVTLPATGAATAAKPRVAPVESAPLYEEKDPEAGLAPLAVVCTVLAIGVMALNLLGSDRAFFANPGETSSFMVPPPEIPAWEQSDGVGGYTSSFTSELRKISSKYE